MSSQERKKVSDPKKFENHFLQSTFLCAQVVCENIRNTFLGLHANFENKENGGKISKDAQIPISDEELSDFCLRNYHDNLFES